MARAPQLKAADQTRGAGSALTKPMGGEVCWEPREGFEVTLGIRAFTVILSEKKKKRERVAVGTWSLPPPGRVIYVKFNVHIFFFKNTVPYGQELKCSLWLFTKERNMS